MSGFDEVGLGKLLQAARKKAGLTQQDLCQKAGLSYSTLAKIERGAIKSPSIFTIQSIAGALGTSLSELMGEPAPGGTVPKKRSQNGVRFVFFDINGCLVRFFQQAFIKLSSDHGVSADAIESTFWHYNDAVCRGEISLAEFNQELAGRLNIPGLDWSDYYLGAIDPIPQMHELVRWASENYHVGLLSNIMPGFIQKMRRQNLIPDIGYSAVIDSSEVGTIKPEQRIYEIAAERAQVAPNEILLIDDSRANLMAAEKMTWHVIWFDDYRPDDSVKRIRAALEPATES